VDALPWPRRLFRAVERVAVAHFAGYPLALLWAVAAIPLTIHLNARALDQLGGDEHAIGDYVVRRLAWPAGAAFVLSHGAAIPWLLARDPSVGVRRCLGILAGLAALGVLSGAASWAWLLLR
jgi:hypothetical protein